MPVPTTAANQFGRMKLNTDGAPKTCQEGTAVAALILETVRQYFRRAHTASLRRCRTYQ